MLSMLTNKNTYKKMKDLSLTIEAFEIIIRRNTNLGFPGYCVESWKKRTATIPYKGYQFSLIVGLLSVEVGVERDGVFEKIVTYHASGDIEKEWHHTDRKMRKLGKEFFENFLKIDATHTMKLWEERKKEKEITEEAE